MILKDVLIHSRTVTVSEKQFWHVFYDENLATFHIKSSETNLELNLDLNVTLLGLETHQWSGLQWFLVSAGVALI